MGDQIKKLVDEGSYKEAFTLFEENLNRLSIDPGEVRTQLFEAFIDATNYINKEYSDNLENIQNLLAELSAKEKIVANTDAIEKIKKEILANKL